MTSASISMNVLRAFLERERFGCHRDAEALCVSAGDWEVRVHATDDRIVGSLRHTSWPHEDLDDLFESLLPDTGQVGLWARRHAANVTLALESLVHEAEPEPMLRILVVDDEELIRTGIRRMLSAHVVDTAADASQAVEILRHRRYDLLLLDVMLPGTDGVRLKRELRRSGIDTPVCFITADPEFIRAPGAPVLVKPFSARRLRAAVRAVASGPGDMRGWPEPFSS